MFVTDISDAYNNVTIMTSNGMRMQWLIGALFLAATLAILAQWALAEHLYWRYYWFDMLMHTIGGALVGTLAVAASLRFRPVMFIAAVAVVAVGWEFFEYAIGAQREANFMLDTEIDLLMGAFGALLIYSIARFTIWRYV